MNQSQRKDECNEMAMVRFSLIAPAINNTFAQPSKRAYYFDISKRPVALPNGSICYFNPSTLSCWESRYRRFGFEGLTQKARSDRGYSRSITSELEEVIADIKKTYPRMNCVEIRKRLIAEGHMDESGPSESTLQRYVRTHFPKGAHNLACKDRKAFEEEFCNGMWQADTLYGPYVKVEKGHTHRSFLQMIIDDKSRMIVAGRFWLVDNAVTFQSTLKSAVATYGIPNKLYVDNGAPYKNDALAGVCGRIGCVLIHAPARDGASKGKVERNFRTLRERFLNCMNPAQKLTVEDLNERLAHYIMTHNATIHSAHNARPIDIWTADAQKFPPKMPESAEWLCAAFRNRSFRRVRKDGTVVLGKIIFDAPAHLIGEQVTIVFTPGDQTDAWVVDDNGEMRALVVTDKVANSRAKRTNSYSISYDTEA